MRLEDRSAWRGEVWSGHLHARRYLSGPLTSYREARRASFAPGSRLRWWSGDPKWTGSPVAIVALLGFMDAGTRPLPEVGFIGLGALGSAIARRMLLVQELMVWDSRAEVCLDLRAAGGVVARSASEVINACRTIFVRVAGQRAVEAVLDLEHHLYAHRTIVQMTPIAPLASERLRARVTAAGGRFVEAQVAGSAALVEQGRLAVRLAGPPRTVAEVHKLLRVVSDNRFADVGVTQNHSGGRALAALAR